MANLVSGRKLVLVDASSLPKMGVQDWEHVKLIAGEIRKLLGQDAPDWNRSISEEPHNPLGMALEHHSKTKGQSVAC